MWNDPERAQTLSKERAALSRVVSNLERVGSGLSDMSELLELAATDDDDARAPELILAFRADGAKERLA